MKRFILIAFYISFTAAQTPINLPSFNDPFFNNLNYVQLHKTSKESSTEPTKVHGTTTIFLNKRGKRKHQLQASSYQDILTIYRIKTVTSVEPLKGLPSYMTHDINEIHDKIEIEYQCKIRINNSVIKPSETDSIIVDNAVGYPDSKKDVWVFLSDKGAIPLYSLHPKRLIELYYYEAGKYRPLPSSLYNSQQLSSHLAQNPRLFSLYSLLPRETILLYNQIYKKASSNASEWIANTSLEYFRKDYSEISIPKLISFLEEDTTNTMALSKLAEKYYFEDSLSQAESMIERAYRHTKFDDYFIYYLDGLVKEDRELYKEAKLLYMKAYDSSRKLTGHFIIDQQRKMIEAKLSDLHKRIHNQE